MRPNFFHHLHPPTIPASQARWRYTLGAGGMAVFLILVLGITGALEMFYYIPTVEDAAVSVQMISYEVPFGGLMRGLHFWSAQLLLLVSSVHLLRVVFTGAYTSPRRFNYLLGLGSFVIIILLDFTGYILRWDQGIQWALVVGTNLLASIPGIGSTIYSAIVGGTAPGQATLTRFYSWHIYGLALVAVVAVVWHAFRVRRDGGLAVPPPRERSSPERISRADLVRREVTAMVLAGAGVILVSMLFPAPIAPAITQDPTLSGDARAPWFFLWVQEMLTWGDPFLWGVLAPFAFLCVVAIVPFILPQPKQSELGRWFPRSSRAVQFVVASMTVLMILLTIFGAFRSLW